MDTARKRQPRRRSRALVGVVALALTLTACGSRADHTLRQEAAAAALGGGGGGNGGGTSGSGGDAAGGTTGGSGGTTGVTTGGTGGTGATGGTTGTGGAATGGGGTGGTGGTKGSTTGGAPAPAGGNGGSTDVGVTGTSITVGNVSDLSGPVPGLFQGAVIGTQAYFAKINSEGGIFGRQLKLKVGDGQLDCGQNKSQTQSLSSKVFAFVGSFSLYDDCGSDVLKANPNIPDVHGALGQKSQALPNNFSVAPLGGGWRTGPFEYYKKKYGAKFTKIGAIYANVGTGPTLWGNTKKSIDHEGGKVVSEHPYGATDTDFTSVVIQMKSNGVQMVFVNTTDGATTARFVNALRSQSVPWPIIFGATAYDSNFLKQAGANAEGVFNDQQFAQFFNKDDAGNIPAVAAFQKWTDVVAGGETKDLFAVYGWSSAQLFVQALKAAGPKAKRADVMAALKKITKFDADGLLAAADPANKKPATCWILNVVKGGKFVRVDSPASTFRCDGSYFPPS